METEKTIENRGGRPPKPEHDRATIKLNCWVTPLENDRLQVRFTQAKAGGKLAFAGFLKQLLLSEKRSSSPKRDELLLTVIINLQERGRQLETINDLLESSVNEADSRDVVQRISEELSEIQRTISQITTWLYES